MYGTGAPVSSIQPRYDESASYQVPAKPVTADIKSWDEVGQLLGDGDHYATFLRLFQREIAAHGWQAVVRDYLLSGSAAADDMLVRTFAGILHPTIHLMHGVEWDQPALVAEGLAQTAVHELEGLPELLPGAEAKSRERKEPMPAIMELFEAVGGTEVFNSFATLEKEGLVEGVMATKERRAALVDLMSRVKVEPGELEERTAEMFDANIFLGASAAIHPVKEPRFDFYLM